MIFDVLQAVGLQLFKAFFIGRLANKAQQHSRQNRLYEHYSWMLAYHTVYIIRSYVSLSLVLIPCNKRLYFHFLAHLRKNSLAFSLNQASVLSNEHQCCRPRGKSLSSSILEDQFTSPCPWALSPCLYLCSRTLSPWQHHLHKKSLYNWLIGFTNISQTRSSAIADIRRDAPT